MDDHDLLIRIDERTKKTEETLDEIKFQMAEGTDRFLDIDTRCVQKAETCDKRFDDIETEQTKVKTVGAVVAFLLTIGTAMLELLRR